MVWGSCAWSEYSRLLRPVFLVWFVAASSPIDAEILHLRIGRSIEGHILRQTADSIDVDTSTGVFSILKKDVLSVEYVQTLPGSAPSTPQERAKYHAERAAALRDLVSTGKMEKPWGEPLSYIDFTWRSALVPGWGHYAMGRPVLGALYFSSGAILFLDVLQQRSYAISERREYTRKIVMNEAVILQSRLSFSWFTRDSLAYLANSQARSDYRNVTAKYNQHLYALQIFYLLQLSHVIWNGLMWEDGSLLLGRSEESEMKATVAVGPDAVAGRIIPAGGALSIGLVYTF